MERLQLRRVEHVDHEKIVIVLSDGRELALSLDKLLAIPADEIVVDEQTAEFLTCPGSIADPSGVAYLTLHPRQCGLAEGIQLC